MSIPIFEEILFRIGMFGGATLFIYFILEIDYKSIVKEIKSWILYIQVIEMPNEKEKRKNMKIRLRLWLHQKEIIGDIYINKFMNRFYPEYQKMKNENKTEEIEIR